METLIFIAIVGCIVYFIFFRSEKNESTHHTSSYPQPKPDTPEADFRSASDVRRRRRTPPRHESPSSLKHRNQDTPELKLGYESLCHLAGAPHYVGGKSPVFMEIFAPGKILEAVRESENPHDAKAILLRLNGRNVGHIPQSYNAVHASHMDAGGRLKVEIIFLNTSAPWDGVSLRVTNT